MRKAFFRKTILMSARIVAIVAVFSAVYGFITHKDSVHNYVFTANLWVGVIILAGGLLILITPTFLLIKKSLLIDHTTYGEKFMEEREHKYRRAQELICIGVCNISITSVVQVITWLVFQQ